MILLDASLISKLNGAYGANPTGKVSVVVSPSFTWLFGNAYSAFTLNAFQASIGAVIGFPSKSVTNAFVITLEDNSSACDVIPDCNTIEKTITNARKILKLLLIKSLFNFPVIFSSPS